MSQRLEVRIRWMLRRDLPQVLGIEEESFVDPYGVDDLIQLLRQRNTIGLVAEYEEQVVGHLVYELHKSELYILRLAVAPTVRRRGVGRELVRKLVDKLPRQRRNRLVLTVRETNLPAQLFFKALGFRATCVLRDFYENPDEDGYVMQNRYRLVPEFALVNRIARYTELGNSNTGIDGPATTRGNPSDDSPGLFCDLEHWG